MTCTCKKVGKSWQNYFLCCQKCSFSKTLTTLYPQLPIIRANHVAPKSALKHAKFVSSLAAAKVILKLTSTSGPELFKNLSLSKASTNFNIKCNTTWRTFRPHLVTIQYVVSIRLHLLVFKNMGSKCRSLLILFFFLPVSLSDTSKVDAITEKVGVELGDLGKSKLFGQKERRRGKRGKGRSWEGWRDRLSICTTDGTISARAPGYEREF